METGPTCHQALGVASRPTASLEKGDRPGITPGATERHSAVFDLAGYGFKEEGYPVVDYESALQTAKSTTGVIHEKGNQLAPVKNPPSLPLRIDKKEAASEHPPLSEIIAGARKAISLGGFTLYRLGRFPRRPWPVAGVTALAYGGDGSGSGVV
uniref:Uncharacterized protein n=1 Tax=Oryza sativa subsp. japonica TaxID=39947 RepID=Q6K8J9_ORYSJ|nr:unknown protein [Oryza sativa Japonica Group]